MALTPDGMGDAVSNGLFVLPYETKMKISNFFEHLESGNSVAYIQSQNSCLLNEFKPLKSDIEELRYMIINCSWASESFGVEPDAVNLWIGNERSKSSLHKDPYENIYCVIAGSKRFTLFPPTDTPFLYRTMYKTAKYDKEFNANPLGYEIPWTHIDPDSPPEEEECPLYKHTTPLHVNLEKGDVLYLPSLWYHQVSQKADQCMSAAVAVNFWYDMKFDARYTWTRFQDDVLGCNSHIQS